MRSTLALRAFELQNAKIESREHYTAELPMIVANRGEIQQVVLNLILNAEHAIRSTLRKPALGLAPLTS